MWFLDFLHDLGAITDYSVRNPITWETEGSLYARGIIVKPKGRIGVDRNSRYKN